MIADRLSPIHSPRLSPPAEAFLAELTAAAYRVALQHGTKGSFIDLQLGMWAALRQVLAGELPIGAALEEEDYPCST